MIQFLKDMFLNNHWLWFHALGAMFLISWIKSFRIVLAIAIVWELIELYLSDISVYGSTSVFVIWRIFKK